MTVPSESGSLSPTISSKPSRLDQVNQGAEVTSQTIYAVCTFITDLYATEQIALSDTAYVGIAMGWDYLDGINSIICGAMLIADSTNHHQTQNKMFGSMMIVSGASQCLLAYQNFIQVAALSGAALCMPVIAMGTLFDLIITSADLYYAAKKSQFPGWLEETCLELAHIDRQLEANNLEKQKDLEAKRDTLLHQIEVRSKVYLHEGDPAKKASREKQIDLIVKTVLSGKVSTRTSSSLKDIKYLDTPSSQEIKEDREIQNTLNENLKNSQRAYFVKILSCIGMTLIALSTFVCPPAFIAGLVITSMVAAYYLYKNGSALTQKLFASNAFKNQPHFFKPAKIEENGDEKGLLGNYSLKPCFN